MPAKYVTHALPTEKTFTMIKPDAFANGAFIMVRRDPFESIGGWGSVRSKISEDLELARGAKRAGLQLRVAQGEDFAQSALASGVGYDELLERIMALGLSYQAEWRAYYG